MTHSFTVVFVTSEFVTEPYCGGLGHYVHRACLSLDLLGVHTIVIAGSNVEASIVHNGIEVHRVDVRRPLWMRAVNRLTCGLFAMSISLAVQSFLLNQALRRIRRKKQIDIVQYAHLGAVGLFRPSDIPAVARISGHQLLWERHGDGHKNPRWQGFQQRLLERRALLRVDGVYSPSRLLAAITRKELAIPVPVLENPFVLDAQASDSPSAAIPLDGKDYLLFFGYLVPLKGVVIIGDILRDLLARHPGLHFAFAGRDTIHMGRPMSEFLRDCAREHRNRVVYLGKLEHPDLYRVISRARFAVLPSLVDNFPNTCLEALAHGCPVIGTSGASLDQIICHGINGFLCQPGNRSDLLNTINGALAITVEDRKAMEFHAKASVSRLAPDHAGRSLVSYYQHAIACRRGCYR